LERSRKEGDEEEGAVVVVVGEEGEENVKGGKDEERVDGVAVIVLLVFVPNPNVLNPSSRSFPFG